MSLVIGELHALSPAARLREGALGLTRAAVFVIVLQVKALVVAARGIPAVFQGVVAYVIVLVTMIGRSRVSLLLLEESADTSSGSRFKWMRWWLRHGARVLGRED